MFSNKTYDVLKWIAQVFLPALITLYGVVSHALGLPHTETVITIAVGVDAFLGTILGISTINYNSNRKDGDSQ